MGIIKGRAFLVITLVMALILVSCGTDKPINRYRLRYDCMEPTLHDGDWITTTLVYRELQRRDIVVFTMPSDSGPDGREYKNVRRIVGLPGETIEVKDGEVYIDGTVLTEPYILEKPEYSLEPTLIPENHYFVLGDNRNHSNDSHTFGPITRDSIAGIVIM